MIGKILSGKYEIKREVGRGGMGVIYEALHTALNRTVAIKVLHPQFTKDSAFLDRFQREARAMARLDHKNIIRVFDVQEEQGTHFIVMEYFKGQNLRQILLKKKKLPQRTVLSIAYQVAKALAYAHDKNVIHRDIKPANIIINKNGVAKIADFGIAATTDEISLTADNHIIGTPEYMSLEQARGETLDGRSDLYALGMVMYEMLTGQTYYTGISGGDVLKKLAYDEAEFDLIFDKPVAPSLQKLVRNLLKKNKDDRIADTSALMQQIKTSKQELKTEVETNQGKSFSPQPARKIPAAPQHAIRGNPPVPPFFKTNREKTGTSEAQATVVTPKKEQTPAIQRSESTKKWPKRSIALIIVTLVFAGIAAPFFKNNSPKPAAQLQIAQLKAAIQAVQEKLAHTHKTSAPDEIRPWAKESYNKAADLETRAAALLREAEKLIKKQSYDAARDTLKNAHFLFSQSHNGYVRAIETAHGKIIQAEQSRMEKEKRAREKASQALARLKKERRKAREERKRQEALLRSELIKLSKEKTKTPKNQAALEKAQNKRKPLLNPPTKKKNPPPRKQFAAQKKDPVLPLNEIDSLGAILSRLTAAYEKKDLKTLQNMSTMSKNRSTFLKQIFKNYKSVSVSVTDLSIEAEQAEAIISITELRTHKNKKTRPPDHWKTVKLIIPKNRGKWDKVIW